MCVGGCVCEFTCSDCRGMHVCGKGSCQCVMLQPPAVSVNGVACMSSAGQPQVHCPRTSLKTQGVRAKEFHCLWEEKKKSKKNPITNR